MPLPNIPTTTLWNLKTLKIYFLILKFLPTISTTMYNLPPHKMYPFLYHCIPCRHVADRFIKILFVFVISNDLLLPGIGVIYWKRHTRASRQLSQVSLKPICKGKRIFRFDTAAACIFSLHCILSWSMPKLYLLMVPFFFFFWWWFSLPCFWN